MGAEMNAVVNRVNRLDLRWMATKGAWIQGCDGERVKFIQLTDRGASQ